MLFLVAALSACREDDAGTPQAKMRTISLNFPAIQPYTASRADNNVSAIEGESTFHTADIWVFDSNDAEGNAAAYKHIEDAERYTTNTGELRTELTIPREITNVDIYVITNNSAEGLNANSTRSRLQGTTFNEKPGSNQDTKLAEDGLLMSRIIEDIPVSTLSGGYDANTQLPLERGVAKIACFFAKESESTQAEITDITVSGATNMGSVFPEVVAYNNGIIPRPDEEADVPTEATNEGTVTITPPTTIPALSEGETLERGTDEDAKDYLPRLNRIASSTDDYYLFEADANKMKVSISYTLGTSEIKTAEVSLDKDVIRNHYVVITGKVKGGILELEYLALQWENTSSTIAWNATPTVAAWNSDDYDAPYEDAAKGDEEASYCYVVYPRYANNEHTQLETSTHEANYGQTVPSYAGFYFKLDAPDGAVWTAHLTNETDFRFGRGQYNAGNERRFCVSTGIARDEPYQIQITANNAWTDVNFNNLEWGNQVEQSGREVFTEFYITVSLDGMEDYELVINPENAVTNTHWKDGRRFAGTDTRIYLWQFKATNGDNFTQIVKNILQANPNHTISKFWDPNSPANNED